MTNTIPNYLQRQIDMLIVLWFHETDQTRRVFALQSKDGTYRPGKGSVTPHLVYRHLRGDITLGAYQLNDENAVKWAAWDLDLENLPRNGDIEYSKLKDFPELKSSILKIYDLANANGRRAYLASSGRRGFHVYVFFDSLISAGKARALGEKVVSGLTLPGNLTAEIFPKQTQKDGGLGSLLKVPWSKHQLSNKRTKFLNRRFERIRVKPTNVIQNPEHTLPDKEVELCSSGKEVDFKIKEELPPFFKKLMQQDSRIRDLFYGHGKEKGEDRSRSGYDFSVLGALILREIDDPSELATILWNRPNAKAREEGGKKYLQYTIGKAISQFSNSQEGR